MSQRLRRVNEAVKEILAQSVPALKDPRVGFVTVTDVRLTPDFRQGEVFYTVLPDDPESLANTAAGLASAAPVLRRELGKLRLRYSPELAFTHDPVPGQGRRIEELLREAPPAQQDDAPVSDDPGQ